MATIFQQTEREDIGNRQEIDKRQQLHLPLIDAFCQTNNPYEIRSQSSGANGIASLGLENSQASELPEPFIRCRTGFMEESSRFNYGYDMVINKRKIDVSGQLIPNEELRSMPQRVTQIHAYQTTRVIPYKTNKITDPKFIYRSFYQTDKNKATYQTPPGDMKPAPYVKTEPGTFP